MCQSALGESILESCWGYRWKEEPRRETEIAEEKVVVATRGEWSHHTTTSSIYLAVLPCSCPARICTRHSY